MAHQSEDAKKKNDQMHVVRKQVQTLLGSAQQGEVSDMKKFLDEFAEEHLKEELNNKTISDELKATKLIEIKREALRNFKDGNGRTAIHFACSSNAEGCSSVVEEILSMLPEAHEIKDDNEATPLILAAGIATKEVAENMVKILLKAGADCKAKDKDGVQALHHACGAGECTVVDLLVSSGAPLNSCSNSGSPLHWAAGEGCYLVVEQLVKLGANVDVTNSQGMTPIFMAAARGADKCLAMLARGGASLAKPPSNFGLTVLHIAADLGLAQGVEALLESEEGRSLATVRNESGLPIQLAAAAAHPDIVQMLLPHSFPNTETLPTLAELMENGGKAAAEHEQEQAKTAADAAAASSLASLIENTKPAASEEAAVNARKAKDEGNVLFIAKDYSNAIVKYTEAIVLDGSDATFFSNRSACWLEIAKSKSNLPSEEVPEKRRALADAEQCRRMKPDWSKGCFRLAAARFAMGLYEDAAVAAYEGLRIDDQNSSLKKLLKEAVAKGREEHFKDQK